MTTDDLNTRLLAALGTTAPVDDEAAPDMVLHQLVSEWLDHKAALEKHARQLADAADLIRKRLQPGQRYEVAAGVGVTVRQPARSYDPTTGEQLLERAELEACTVTTLDHTKAKAILKARHVLDQAMKPGSGTPQVVAL